MTIGNINIKNKYILIVIVFISLILIFSLLNWLINSSFIEINTTNNKTGEYKYSFSNQSNGNNIELLTINSQIKQLLQTNSYNVSVQQNYHSYFTVVKTDRFLANSYIEAKLVSENKREFVGNNPGSCMSYVKQVLVTFSCEGLLANALVHIPASQSVPTFATTTRGKGPAGYYEGIFETKGGSFALSHIPYSSELGQTHMLNKLGDNFISVEAINITKLNPSDRYSAVKYKDGFIAYNRTFSDVQYFPNLKDQSTNISGVVPDNSYNPINLDTNKDTIMTSYVKDNKTYIYFNNNGTINSLVVNKSYSTVNYCGVDSYLCMLNDKLLDVYKINNNQAEYKYSISGVERMLTIGSDLLIVNNSGVVKFNVDSKIGYFTYSFGDYKFNSIVKTTAGDKFVINMTNPKGDRVALLISPSDSNNDNIDKKIIELINVTEVNNLSIYGNYISIVPNITPKNARGNIANNQVIEPNKEQIDITNNRIKEFINNLGIDSKKYTINFTIN